MPSAFLSKKTFDVHELRLACTDDSHHHEILIIVRDIEWNNMLKLKISCCKLINFITLLAMDTNAVNTTEN